MKTHYRKGRLFAEALLASTVFALLLSFSTHLLYQKSLNALEQEIKLGLLSDVRTAAQLQPGSLHAQVSQNTSRTDPIYVKLAALMEQIRQQTQDVRYIYTTIMLHNEVYFMINQSPQNDNDGDGVADEAPALMTPYPDAPEELKRALRDSKPQVSERPYKDEWGTFISAYAPIVTPQGKTVAVLAMDLELSSFYQRLQPVEDIFGKAVSIVAFLSLTIGLLVYWLRGRSEQQSLFLLSLKRRYKALQQSSKVQALKQLNQHALPWQLIYGRAEKTANYDFDSSQGQSGGNVAFASWFLDQWPQLSPCINSSLELHIPDDCGIWADTDELRRFWRDSLALWHDCIGLPLQVKWTVAQELKSDWLLDCHISALDGKGNDLARGQFWSAFIEWQQQACMEKIELQLVDKHQLVLRCSFCKFAGG